MSVFWLSEEVCDTGTQLYHPEGQNCFTQLYGSSWEPVKYSSVCVFAFTDWPENEKRLEHTIHHLGNGIV